MATQVQDYAASVAGVAIRVTKLSSTGGLLTDESYTSKAFIRVSFTPEYEEGDEITEKNADGTVCVTFKAPDTLKRVTMEIAVCDPDPVLSWLLSGGVLLAGEGPPPEGGGTADTEALGWAAAKVGEDPSGDGVAVEVWSRAIVDGKPSGVMPYFHWVFPYVKTRLSGDRVIENGLLANTYEGFGVGNTEFGSGPDKTTDAQTEWRWPEVTDRPYMYARSQFAPDVSRGMWDYGVAGGPTGVNPIPATPTAGDNIYEEGEATP